MSLSIEKELREKNSFLRILHAVAITANKAVGIEDAFGPALKVICQHTTWYRKTTLTAWNLQRYGILMMLNNLPISVKLQRQQHLCVKSVFPEEYSPGKHQVNPVCEQR